MTKLTSERRLTATAITSATTAIVFASWRGFSAERQLTASIVTAITATLRSLTAYFGSRVAIFIFSSLCHCQSTESQGEAVQPCSLLRRFPSQIHHRHSSHSPKLCSTNRQLGSGLRFRHCCNGPQRSSSEEDWPQLFSVACCVTCLQLQRLRPKAAAIFSGASVMAILFHWSNNQPLAAPLQVLPFLSGPSKRGCLGAGTTQVCPG